MEEIKAVNKFGVKLDGENMIIKFPHLKNRFKVDFFNENNEEILKEFSQDIKRTELPIVYDYGVKDDEVEKDYIFMEAYSSIDNTTIKEALVQLNSHNLFNIHINLVDGTFNPLSRWVLRNCIIRYIKNDELEYNNFDAMKIKLKIFYKDLDFEILK